MIARLSSADHPELQALSARSTSDASIALLDAWSMVADVLTFYQERIANEGYLATSTELRSILETARLVGYELRTGVAATTYLAYTLDKDFQGRDTIITIPKGSRAQSVPPQDGQPQAFETAADLLASSAWNDLKPRRWRPTRLSSKTISALEKIYLEGVASNLKPGDTLLVLFTQSPLRTVAFKVGAVDAEHIIPEPPGPPLSRTIVSLQKANHAGAEASGSSAPHGSSLASSPAEVQTGTAFDALGSLIHRLEVPPSDIPVSPLRLDRKTDRLFATDSDVMPRLLATLAPSTSDFLYKAWANADVASSPGTQAVMAMRTKAAPFGSSAPLKPIIDGKGAFVGSEEWPLRDPLRLKIRLDHDQHKEKGVIEVSVQSGADRDTVVSNLSGKEKKYRLGQGEVVIASKGPSGADVHLLAGLPELHVKIRFDSKSDGYTVVFDDQEEIVLRPGEMVDRTEDGQRSRLELNETSSLTLSINRETLVPATELNVLTLDGQYSLIVPGSWVVIEWAKNRRQTLIAQVDEVSTVTQNAYNLSAQVTELKLSLPWLQKDDLLLSAVRDVTVFAQSEEVALAPEPIEDDVALGTIELDGLYEGLVPGRWLVVSGERTDIPEVTGVYGSELTMLALITQVVDPTLPGDKVHTVLGLAKPLAFTYKRGTTKVWGNVVRSTQGATVDAIVRTASGELCSEVLGSGDSAKPFQRFNLKQKPLTYLPAANVTGAESALEVRVDQVRWREVDTLVDLTARDRAYMIRHDEDGNTAIVFGDGEHGTRCPAGSENITAMYRIGLGRAGNVGVNQVTQLTSRPLGVSAVTNPVPASGGADREGLTASRRNASLGTRSLDRLVSTRDYEDLARSRTGIAKASARHISDGTRQLVHLTIAGTDDAPIASNSDLLRGLRQALHDLGDPAQPFIVASRELALLVISAGVELDADYHWANVEPKLRSLLLDRFGFDNRDLGQAVFLSEIQSAMHSVPGVVSVDIDAFAGVPGDVTLAQLAQLSSRLKTKPAPFVPVALARHERKTHVVVHGESLSSIASNHATHVRDILNLNPQFAAGISTPPLGAEVLVSQTLKPAQLAMLSAAVPDTLILSEVRA